MSYRLFTKLFFSHDHQTREKMLGQFMNIMHYHARIHPQQESYQQQIPIIRSRKRLCYRCTSYYLHRM